jgi:raffinose/stachyose/melibiose transport system permease protein
MNRTPGSLLSHVAAYGVLILLVVIFLIPVVFVFFTAVKSNPDLLRHPFYSIPQKIELGNFRDAWIQGRLSQYMRNSLIISVIKVPLGILIEALAAFALTRMAFRMSDGMFVFFLIGLMVPMQVTLVPLNIMLNRLHLISTYPGIILVYVGFGIPFGILVLRGFLRTIPMELDEAARIDGCGDLQRFTSVILPLATPALSALLILDFLATWNEFVLAQIFLTRDSMKTITTGLLVFQGQFLSNYTLLNAAVVISLVPPLVIYIIFQRYFVSGVAGAVKG